MRTRLLFAFLVLSSLVAVAAAADKPGGLPSVPNIDGKVPVFPAGEQHREVPAVSAPAKPAHANSAPMSPAIPEFRLSAESRSEQLVLVRDNQDSAIYAGFRRLARQLRDAYAAVLRWFMPESYQLLWLPESF